MARYTALTDGCIGTHYVRAGEVFDFDGCAPRWARAEVKPTEKPTGKKPMGKKPASRGSGKAGE